MDKGENKILCGKRVELGKLGEIWSRKKIVKFIWRRM